MFGKGQMVQDIENKFLPYVLLGNKNVEYSLLYYACNYVLGQLYLYFFKSEYRAANKERIPFEIANINNDNILV